MKRVIISALMFTLILGTASLFSQSQKHNRKVPDDFRRFKIQKMLKLSDEQLVKFNDIKSKNQLSVIDIQAEIKKNRVNIKNMMANNKVDADKLIELTDANSDLHGNIKSSKTKMWLDIYNLLNEEQKVTWTKTFNRFGQGKKVGRKGIGFGRYNCSGNCRQEPGRRNYKDYKQK